MSGVFPGEMISPTVTEIPPRLEPVTPDPFIAAPPRTPALGGRRAH